MENWKNAPAPLKRKLVLTVSAGILCLLVGVAMCVYSKDNMMLFLSLAVFGVSIYKAYTVYRVVSKQQYEIIEGICIGVIPKPLQRFRKVRIKDNDGNETTLLLNKQSKVKIGDRYRFYFQKTSRVALGSDYLDTVLSSDCFLGYEAVSEQEK
ncbi:MAG: hypothetical protein IJ011_00285 [Clostridia bacterium]|nr:hypothetical protein [Clostridia bacterium]